MRDSEWIDAQLDLERSTAGASADGQTVSIRWWTVGPSMGGVIGAIQMLARIGRGIAEGVWVAVWRGQPSAGEHPVVMFQTSAELLASGEGTATGSGYGVLAAASPLVIDVAGRRITPTSPPRHPPPKLVWRFDAEKPS